VSLPDEVDSLKKESQVDGSNKEGYQANSLKKESQGQVDGPELNKDGQVDDSKKDGRAMKQRALLIGIAYTNAKNWSPLEGPHDDVEQYRELLSSTYGYRPEDVVVLKDDPKLPEHLQPTRVNLIRELNALVSDATPGDRFTLFYSGHSDQQDAKSDMEEEDGMDEMLITCDEQSIIDNELREILVLPLPVGCSLLAVLDTCHSGTMLDLPHHHCNSVYVPWQSKGERRTMTMQNVNVRRQATGFVEQTSGDILSIETVIEEGEEAVGLPLGQPLQLNTKLGGSRPAGQREMSPTSTVASPVSPGGQSRGRRGARMSRDRERMSMMFTQTRCASPEPRFVCDGWCKHSEVSHPNVLSLSACSDLQRAWEGPNGSLTTILCNYLKQNSYPSYGALMSHINFQLHDNALALHEYTRDQRKKAHRGQGDGFDGELDNFQEPELSSIVRLNMEDTLQL